MYTRLMSAPPQVGDQVVIGDWYQFKSTVSLVEEEYGSVIIHVTTEYPDDPYFTRKADTIKVFLHDEGRTWHRLNSYPHLN